MSVLIKGIDLPEAYTSAWLTVFECVGEHTFIKTHKVSAEQIQAIPPHGPLIDGDNLIELCGIMADKCDGIGVSIWEQFAETVRWCPTIIEAEEGEDDD